MTILTEDDVRARFARNINGEPGLDQVLSAWAAAEAYVADRCEWPEDHPPAVLGQAVELLTRRYLARRNSPDGLVGSGEYGPVRVTTVDRDVERLIFPWRRMVLA